MEQREPSRANRRLFGAIGVALALMISACSIEAPDIELVGGPAAPVAPGAVPAGGTSGGDASADPGAPGAPAGGAAVSAADTDRCARRATDVGVTADTVRLGSTFALSGPVSNISGPILKGVQAYLNKVNASGGVHGRKLDLTWYDDGWDAQRGKGLIKRLVEQDKVFALAVVPSSNGLDASKSYLEARRMPVFGTSGLIESQFQSPMQWAVGASTKSISRVALVQMKRDRVRNLAVIWLDLLAGRTAMEATYNAVKPIMGVAPEDFLVNTQGYRVSISEPDFGPVWARVMEDTRRWQRAHGATVNGIPDYVEFAIDPTNAVKALQAAENMGFRPRVGWAGGPPLFLDLVPQSAAYAARTGLLASTSYYPPIGQFLQRPAVADYVSTVRRYYGDDVDVKNPYLEGGYAGAALVVEVLKRAGPCLTRDAAVRAADSLQGYSAAGLTPPLTFNPFGRGRSHFGNISVLTVKVDPQGRWAVERDFVADPSPGAK